MYNERRSVRPSLNFTFLPLGVASILSPLLANEAFSLVINVPIFSFPLLFVSTLSSRSRSYSVCLSFSVGIYKISYTTRRIHGMRKYTIFGLSRSSEKAIHEACFASVGNQRVQKISRVIACIFKRGITVPRRRGTWWNSERWSTFACARERPTLYHYRYYYQLKRVSRLVSV